MCSGPHPVEEVVLVQEQVQELVLESKVLVSMMGVLEFGVYMDLAVQAQMVAHSLVGGGKASTARLVIFAWAVVALHSYGKVDRTNALCQRT